MTLLPGWKLTSEDQHTLNGIRQPEAVYPQKYYFHFRFSTNSGGFLPMAMQAIFM